MYTRCPSCRAQICFQPPANAADLPEGYRQRVRCPNCGVTIGVKLPGNNAIAQAQPTFTPQNPYAQMSEPVYTAPVQASAPDEKTAKREARALAASNKKSGRSRNVMIFIFAALLLVCSVLGHFYADAGGATMEDIANGNALEAGDFLSALEAFDGVGVLSDIANDELYAELLKETFAEDIATGLLEVLPVIFFLLAALTAALALIGFIVKKYPRLLHLILALGLLAVSVCILFSPLLGADGAGFDAIGDYFMNTVVSDLNFLLLAPAVIGVLHLLFSLIFLKSLKKKTA